MGRTFSGCLSIWNDGRREATSAMEKNCYEHRACLHQHVVRIWRSPSTAHRAASRCPRQDTSQPHDTMPFALATSAASAVGAKRAPVAGARIGKSAHIPRRALQSSVTRAAVGADESAAIKPFEVRTPRHGDSTARSCNVDTPHPRQNRSPAPRVATRSSREAWGRFHGNCAFRRTAGPERKISRSLDFRERGIFVFRVRNAFSGTDPPRTHRPCCVGFDRFHHASLPLFRD